MNLSTSSPSSSPSHSNRVVQVAAWVVILWGVAQARELLVPLCLAALLAFLMAPIIRRMERARFPEGLSVILSALLLILPIAGAGILIVGEVQHLVKNWPEISATIKTTVGQLSQNPKLERFHLNAYLDVNDLEQRLSEGASTGFHFALESLKAMAKAGTTLILVLFFAIVMIASRAHVSRSLEKILFASGQVKAGGTLVSVAQLIERFLIARLSIVALVAIVDFIILMSFGVSYGFLMGCLLGLMTLVPIVGFFVGVIPPMIVAIAAGVSVGKLVALFLCLGSVSSFQDHFLAPKWIGKKLNLNFLFTYLGIFAGERLWGPWGMFLSVPILGVIRVALEASPRFKPWSELLEEDSKKSK